MSIRKSHRWLLPLAALMLLACRGQLRKSGDLFRIVKLESSPTQGAKLYAAKCKHCHGSKGQGRSAPSIKSALGNMSDADLVEQILEGSLSMPAIRITPQEAMHIVGRLRMLSPTKKSQ